MGESKIKGEDNVKQSPFSTKRKRNKSQKSHRKTINRKAIQILDPLPEDPKPPDGGKDENAGTIKDVSMEWEAGERILAIKLNRSQNPSTSVVLSRLRRSSLDRRDKKQENSTTLPENVQYHNRSGGRVVRRTQIITEEKDVEKVHWNPPCKLKLQQK